MAERALARSAQAAAGTAAPGEQGSGAAKTEPAHIEVPQGVRAGGRFTIDTSSGRFEIFAPRGATAGSLITVLLPAQAAREVQAAAWQRELLSRSLDAFWGARRAH